MAEISAKELRRLLAVERRLTKAQEVRKDLAAEGKALSDAVAKARREAERVGAESDQERKRFEELVEKLLAENKRLAERVEELTDDLNTVRARSKELRDAAREGDRLTSERRDQSRRLRRAEHDLAAANRKLEAAEQQLAKGKAPRLLPPEEVGDLIDRFVGQVGDRLPGLRVMDGEVKLRVGFAKVGTTVGLVIPSATAAEELPGALHDVMLRFVRLELPEDPTD